MQHFQPLVAPSASATRRRRPRVGLIVPRSNTTCEAEMQDFAASGFSVHTARMATVAGSLASDPQATTLAALAEPLEDLKLCRVDLVALGCTNAAMACDQQILAEALRSDPAVPVVLISRSIIRALAEVGAKRVALFTPYTQVSNRQIADFLGRHGFEVTAAVGLDLNTGPKAFSMVSELTRDYLLAEIAAMDLAGADCLLISCTDLHSLDILDEIAATRGVPVLSSNRAFFQDIRAALAETNRSPRIAVTMSRGPA